MKGLQKQLRGLSDFLSMLTKQLEKVLNQLDKLDFSQGGILRNTKVESCDKKDVVSKKTKPLKKMTMLDQVYEVIRRSRKGVNILTIKDKTGLSQRQVNNALYKLTKQEKIQTKSRGIYTKK